MKQAAFERSAVQHYMQHPPATHHPQPNLISHGSVGARDPRWPDSLEPEAYHGLVGDIVRTIAPHTEADPAALLIQLLVGLGNVVGRSPYFSVEADRHGANLFAVIVGETSKARKGTSLGYVKRLLRDVDPTWVDSRLMDGLSSGEGLI